MHQRMTLSAVVFMLGAGLIASAAPSRPPSSADVHARPGPFVTATATYNWHDNARDRDVPVKIYYPATNSTPCPVIIFSHGLGGSREGYEYLGRHWASYGYLSVHLTHIGSDTSVMTGTLRPYKSMQKAAADIRNAIDRPRDVSFVIDQMTAMNTSDVTFKGRLAMDRVGVAGHSFGGYTALASAGQSFVVGGGQQQTPGDPRIKAAIAMSAPAKPRDEATLDRMYGSIKIPCFHMTGTKDDSPIGETRAEDRRIPFDHMSAADNYLLILTGGDHMVFSGRRLLLGGGPKDDRFHELILMGSTAFWDAYLKGDAAAKAWMSSGGFKSAIGTDGTYEQKTAFVVRPARKGP